MGAQAQLPAGEMRAPTASDTSFTSNLRLPIHRWYRYSAGYSAEWAHHEIRREQRLGATKVLDPFAGSGTSLLAADQAGVLSWGFEAQPFVYRVCKAKLDWDRSPDDLSRSALAVLSAAQRLERKDGNDPPELVARCFSPTSARQLQALSQALAGRPEGVDPAEAGLLWLALVGIIRRASHAGTAPWQYVLPNRRKRAAAPDVYEAYSAQVALMAADMQTVQGSWQRGSTVLPVDARKGSESGLAGIDFVLTSPPYANNYDYGDATRLELTVLDEIEGWADLREYRKDLIVSCSQHAAYEKRQASDTCKDHLLAPIRPDLQAACLALTELRGTKGGKKQYDDMVASYFLGMAQHWRELAEVLRPGANLCYVVGDSAPYGVPVPTDAWLARLAEPHGFEFVSFEKSRDRNTKWKNRKHRVPLKEGNLRLRFDP